jgi:hypothetical protein
MASINKDCVPQDPNIDPIYPGSYDEISSLDVITRYKKLMKATLEDDSLYEKSKQTIQALSEELQLTEKERANILSGQITQMTIGLSNAAMQTAYQWAERDAKIGYETALINAQAEQASEAAKKIGYEICLLQSQDRSVCADIEVKLASSMRDNGKVLEYDINDPCKPTRLADEGVKFTQIKNYEATKYSTLADSFRKSGKVTLATDGSDGELKGFAGDDKGHTNAQTKVALRQIVSFEDSKRNHAVNASSQTIGQMIASESELDPVIIDNYNKGMEYLLSNSPTVMPGGPTYLTPVEIDFSTSDTDTLTCNASTPPVCDMTTQVNQDLDGNGDPVKGYITFRANFPSGSNTRIGDKVVVETNSGEYLAYKDVSSDDLNNGYVLMKIPSVVLDTNGGSTKAYAIDSYIQDYYGNKSTLAEITVNIQYTQIN